MLKSSLRKLLSISQCNKSLIRNALNANTEFNIEKPHMYSKTWTKSELIQYLKDNIVYESDDHIVSSVPQGIVLKKTSEWADTVGSLACNADLNEIVRELPVSFKSESIFLTKYPKRHASGLIIFSKSLKAKKYLSNNFTFCSSNDILIYKYLAVVLGCPDQTLSQTFVLRPVKIGDKFGTEVLEKWNNSKKKNRKVCYQHEVIASSEHVSLVKVEVSNDVRDCVRHILATKCLTPVLGDSWNYVKKNSILFDVPVAINPSVVKDPVALDPELLAKLQLKSNGEHIIPVHTHLQSIKLPIKKNEEFFVSVPPPESFVWSCHQLGLHEINYYRKAK